MKRTLLFGAALCLAAGVARAGGSHEQPPPPSYNAALAGAAALSRSTAASQSHSTSYATGGNAVARGGAGYGYGQGGSSSSGGNVWSSSYSARGNTPDVMAPSINGGDPCTVGASAGGSGPGLGLVLGGLWEGRNCTLRQDAALLYNMGQSTAAKNVLCQDTRFSTAFANSGQPCEADIRRWQAEGYHQDRRGFWIR